MHNIEPGPGGGGLGGLELRHGAPGGGGLLLLLQEAEKGGQGGQGGGPRPPGRQ